MNSPAGQMAICAALICCASQAHATEVDTAIVFAVDVYGSVDPATAYLQREGHAAAISSQAVLAAINRSRTGCIAITYVEWSSYGQMRSVIPWTHICGADDAHTAASAIRNGGNKGLGCESICQTSLSFAIDGSVTLFRSYTGNPANKIIDISANGINNDGLPVEQSRLRAIAAGCTINVIALPYAMPGIRIDLSQYFADNVIGGPNAFVMPLASPGVYASALRQKLVREISAADPIDEVLSNPSDPSYSPRL
ncbi:DUF1194 domain-containing protein [Aminobacter sp. SR38]|jgi:hypothetical protein|uniref:DUF1194 domain-containing protein n=1 Tax=Aminobacter sp. SR38 TaxID=2774562 RepID=UPI001FEF47D8|nr:DUF1194 domain-containing protein [Aminobacter sp. SR38]